MRYLNPKSEFSRNVLTLMTGTTIAQAIPVAVMPILTRVYSPEDFGVLALFVAISMILGSIANARYELAIMLPEKDEDAASIAMLAMLISSCFSILLLIPFILWNSDISNFLGNAEIGYWLYFIPITVWLIALFNVLNYLNSRKMLYRDISIANVQKASAMAFAQTILGIIKISLNGLVIGQIISHIVSNLKLSFNAIQKYNGMFVFNIEKILTLAKDNDEFPKYMMPATGLNMTSSKVVEIVMPSLFGMNYLGFYFLVQKVLAGPASIIGNSFSEVLFQKLSRNNRDGKAFKSVFMRAFYTLLITSIILFAIAFIVAKDFFEIVFGEDWIVAGEIAQIMIPLIAIQFVVSPLTRVNQVLKNTKKIFIWQFFLLVTYIAVLLFSSINMYSFYEMLNLMVMSISFCYLIYLIVIIKEVLNVK